jgi:hypothetical protein
VVITGATAIAAALWSLSIPRTYEAMSYLQIGMVGDKPLEGISQIKNLTTAFPNLQRIAASLGISTSTDRSLLLRDSIDIKTVGGEMITISVQGTDRKVIIDTADAVVAHILKRHGELFNNALSEIRPAAALKLLKEGAHPNPHLFRMSPTTVILAPYSDGIPIKPNRRQIVVSLSMGGFLLAVLAAYCLERKTFLE